MILSSVDLLESKDGLRVEFCVGDLIQKNCQVCSLSSHTYDIWCCLGHSRDMQGGKRTPGMN